MLKVRATHHAWADATRDFIECLDNRGHRLAAALTTLGQHVARAVILYKFKLTGMVWLVVPASLTIAELGQRRPRHYRRGLSRRLG